MKYLSKQQKYSNDISTNERNGYRGVVAYDTYDEYNDDPDVDYVYRNMKTTRFTIRMLESGKIHLVLLNNLPINYVDFSVFDSNLNSIFPQGNKRIFYDPDEINHLESITFKQGWNVRVQITWYTNTSINNRRFVPVYDESFTYETDIVGSSIYCDAKYEVYGNIMSLINYHDFESITIENGGGVNFLGFFQNMVDNGAELTDWWTEGDDDSQYHIDYSIANNENLLDAYYLYLPGKNIKSSGIYRRLFCRCTNLLRGPKQLECDILVNNSNGGSKYREMFYDCTSLLHAPVMHVTNDVATTIQQQFHSMYNNCTSLNVATIILSQNRSNLYGESFYRMFDGCSLERLNICNISATDSTIYNEMRPSNTNTTTINRMNIDKPKIWLEKFSNGLLDFISIQGDKMTEEELQDYVDSGDYINAADCFEYVGTCWMEDDYRSYYMWHSLAGNSNYLYVLTSEKDFTGLSLSDNIKNRCRPVAYVLDMDQEIILYNIQQASSFNDEITTLLDETYTNVRNYILASWNGIVPEDVAGTPRIWVDDMLTDDEDVAYEEGLVLASEWNYGKSYYDCDEFRLIGELDGSYLWEYCGCVGRKHRQNEPGNPNSGNPYYLISSEIDMDTYLDGPGYNYGDCYSILDSDRDGIYTDSDPSAWVIKKNGVNPDDCDYQF